MPCIPRSGMITARTFCVSTSPTRRLGMMTTGAYVEPATPWIRTGALSGSRWIPSASASAGDDTRGGPRIDQKRCALHVVEDDVDEPVAELALKPHAV